MKHGSNYFICYKRTENILERGENAGYQHFVLFLIVFKSLACQGHQNLCIRDRWFIWNLTTFQHKILSWKKKVNIFQFKKFPRQVNCLPNNKNLDQTKLKSFADVKLIFANVLISLIDRMENIVGKGENAGLTSIFSFSHNVFIAFFYRVVKSPDCVV